MNIDFLLSAIALFAIYSTIVTALDLQFSYGNMINLGVVAYVAAGGYAYAIVTQGTPGEYDENKYGFGLPIVAGLVIAALAGAILGALTAGPTLKMRGEYLALMTFAFAEIFHIFLENGKSLTNGLIGLPNVARPINDAEARTQSLMFACICLALAIVAHLLVRRVVTSPFGRLLLAVADDEQGVAAIGRDIRWVRLTTFLLGSMILGLAGAFLVMYVHIATPSVFTPDVTFMAWIALVLGGVRKRWGPVIGAAILIGLQEGLDLITVAPDQAATVSSLRVLAIGALMVIILRLRPPEHIVPKVAARRGRGAGDAQRVAALGERANA